MCPPVMENKTTCKIVWCHVRQLQQSIKTTQCSCQQCNAATIMHLVWQLLVSLTLGWYYWDGSINELAALGLAVLHLGGAGFEELASDAAG